MCGRQWWIHCRSAAAVWISLATPEKDCESVPPHSPRVKGLKTWSIGEVILVELQSIPNPPFGMDESCYLSVLF
jgi:hypothetical protein